MEVFAGVSVFVKLRRRFIRWKARVAACVKKDAATQKEAHAAEEHVRRLKDKTSSFRKLR